MLSSSRLARALVLLAYLVLLGAFFAMVEIQIEGAQGWAVGLPTWRIESHWLLDWFWGGRPMTGYHAWVFPFMLLLFHLPLVLTGLFTGRLAARCLGSVMLFWIIEDFCWFLLNPAFGLAGLNPVAAPWHKHWWLGLPKDYYLFGLLGLTLLVGSYRERAALSGIGGQNAGLE